MRKFKINKKFKKLLKNFFSLFTITVFFLSGILGGYLKVEKADAAYIARYSGGLLVYADDTVGTPKYKVFDDTTGFGAEQSASSVGASAINWIRVAASPTQDRWIIATRDAADVIKAQVCSGVDNGVSCGAATTISATAGTHGFRNFDVAFENTSGDALLVYGTNTADELRKIEWTGGAWANDAAITTTRTTGTVEWVELTSRLASNQIGIAYADTNDDISAYRWSGTAVGDEATAVITATGSTANVRKMDVSFATTSGNMIVAAPVQGAGTTAVGQLANTTWTIAANTAPDNITDYIDLQEPNPADNDIAMVAHGVTAAGANTMEGYEYDAAALTTSTGITDGTIAVDTSALNWVANNHFAATTYASSTYYGVAVVSDTTGADDINWWTMTSAGVWVVQTDNTRTRGNTSFIDVFDYPNANKVLAITSDANSDIWADTWDATTTGAAAWTDRTSGGALETLLSTATKDVVDFAFRLAPPVTYLADGTDGVSPVTIAPGAGATEIDRFSVFTDISTDTVTGLTVNLLPANAFNNIATVGVYTTGDVLKCSATPASNTVALSTCAIAVTTTPTDYVVKITPKTHANMPIGLGESYATTATVSTLVDTNVNDGSDTDSNTITVDNLSPTAVTGATATAGDTLTNLAWTNPVDADLSKIVVLRRQTTSVADTPVEGTNYTVGNTIGTATVACVVTAPTNTCQDTGLTNGQGYHYRIFTQDSRGNYDSLAIPTFQTLIVGGGKGGGQRDNDSSTGGSGALGGSVYYNATMGVAAGAYTITVGAKGTGRGGSTGDGTNGGNSSAFSNTANGSTTTTGVNSNGGGGTLNSISGSSVYYGANGAWGSNQSNNYTTANGGGASGAYGSGYGGNASTYGSGGGGGGTAFNILDQAGWGGDGSAGVVIIRYTTANFGASTGGTITTSGADKIHTFTSSGTFTLVLPLAGVVPTGSPVTPIQLTTTLGDGTDGSSSTIAPGVGATEIDRFSLVTNAGTDTVTGMTVTLAGNANAYTNIATVGVYTTGDVLKCSATPSANDVALTSCAIAVTTSSTEYVIKITPKTHANMPAVPGASYATTATVTSTTKTNTGAGTDTDSATITVDNLSPGNVTSATATAGDTLANLAWSNPVDADLSKIVILRRATSAVADVPVEGTNYTAGNTIGTATVACVITSPTATCQNTGLVNGTVYHYKIFSLDSRGNYDAGVVPTGSPVTPVAPTTTLGNGGDLLNSTIEPGGIPAEIDNFTLQTSVGTDTVTGMTVTLAGDVNAYTNIATVKVESASSSWTERTNSGSRDWRSVASSSDGTKLVAVSYAGQIYTSTDSGANWTPRDSSRNWRGVASSSDGTKLVAVPNGANIYTSTDSGANWTEQTNSGAWGWSAVASSNDGTKLAAIAGSYYIFTSVDSGVTWSTNGNSSGILNWNGIASSSDGTKLVAVVNGGQIYTSTDSGLSWVPRDSNRAWVRVASSADGTKLVAVIYGGYIYTSTDSGANWTQQTNSGSRNWLSVSSSADGTKIVAAVSGGYIYTSTNSGANWTEETSAGSRNWQTLSSSYDGLKLMSGVSTGSGYIYTKSGTTYCTATPSSNTVVLTGCNIPVNTNFIDYKVTIISKTHANMPSVPGASYATTGTVTSITATNATAGTDTESATITVDNLSPGNVTSATATAGDTLANLAWSNPVDADLSKIVILRRATSAVADVPVEGTNYTAGNTIGTATVACVITSPTATCQNTGLVNGTVYHYKIFSLDSRGNYDAGVVPTGSPVTPIQPTTTLGDGTDGSNSTIEPGGIPAEIDRFTLATNTGTDTVTGMTVTLAGNASAYTNIATVKVEGITSSWTERTGAGFRNWDGIASSADGTKLAAVVSGSGYIYTSTDSGTTWSTNGNSSGARSWYAIASSSDGTKLVAGVYGGYIYTSIDSGANWTQQTNSGSRNWTSISSSSDGTKLAATAYGGYIYTSTDSGVTWTQQTNSGSRTWYSVTSSSDGTKLASVPENGYVYTSTDSGATWTQQTNSGSRTWYFITSSMDGTKLAVGHYGGYIYTSTDSGVNWTQQTNSGIKNWLDINSSSDGTKLIAGVQNGYLYTSTDSGANWTEETSAGSRNWNDLVLSYDGTKVGAVNANGYIYTKSEVTYCTATPSSNTVALTGCNIPVTTTPTEYKVTIVSKTHANMPAVPGASYATTATVTSTTKTNTGAGTDTDSATITVDNLSPGNVTSATATAGNALVNLAWTNPGDADLSKIVVLKRQTTAVADVPVEGTNYTAGNTIGTATVAYVGLATSFQDTNVINGTVYHYKIFSLDSRGNYDAGVVPTGSPVTPLAPTTTLGDGTTRVNGDFVLARGMGGSGTDEGRSTITDSLGNIYTTGWFYGTADFDPGAGTSNLVSAGQNDVFISKLDSSGNFVWAKKMGGTSYDGAYFITIDSSGNIYTTGSFSGTADFDPGAGTSNLVSAGQNDVFISKLDSSGTFVWAKKIGGTSSEEGKSITVDSLGNVYSTGQFYGTSDFDPGGSTYDLTSSGSQDIFVSKLDSSGNFVWAKSIGGTSGDQAESIFIDAFSNVYTTGTFVNTVDFDPGAGTTNLVSTTNFADPFVSKLDSNGDFIWAKSFDGGTNDTGRSIFVDSSGNVYTTGNFVGTMDFDPGAGTSNLTGAGSSDIFVSKLDSSGNFVWAKNMGGTGLDIGYSTTVDLSGNIYTTGSFNGTADFDPGAGTSNLVSVGVADIFVSKLDSSGNFVWAKKMGDTSPDVGNSITLDSLGNVYTVGNFQSTVDFDPGGGVSNLVAAGSDDIFISKLLADLPSTIGPSVGPVEIDRFSLTNNTATNNVTGLTVTLSGNASAYTNIATVGVYDINDVLKCSATPSANTVALSTCGIAVTNSLTNYVVKITPKTHANMSAVPGFSYTTTALVTAITADGGYSTAGSDTTSGTIIVDNLSPGNVTSATVSGGNALADLAWSNPVDADLSKIVILRRETSAVADVPVEGTNYTVGNTIGTATVACVITSPTATCQNTGLVNGTVYHYKIFSLDSRGNYDAGVVPTGSPVTPTALPHRYWVGGSAVWDATAGSKWAYTSGGQGGASVPATIGDAYFNAASGNVTVTISGEGAAIAKDVNFTGFTGTLAGASDISISGDLILSSSMTNNYTGPITFNATSGLKTITSNNKNLNSNIYFDGIGGSWQISDGLRINDPSKSVNLISGNFNANNNDVTSGSIVFSGANNKVLTMGSGTFTLTGTGSVWNTSSASNLTINQNTSTIKITNNSAGAKTFEGQSRTYNTLWLSGEGNTGDYIITGNNTFNTFRDDSRGAHSIKFAAGSTQTINNFDLARNSGQITTITSTNTATHNLVSTGSNILVDFVRVEHSVATGTGEWRAGEHSINNNNTATPGSGWVFNQYISRSGSVSNVESSATPDNQQGGGGAGGGAGDAGGGQGGGEGQGGGGAGGGGQGGGGDIGYQLNKNSLLASVVNLPSSNLITYLIGFFFLGVVAVSVKVKK